MPAYRESKYDYVLISDSNVRVDGDYLKAIVSHMEDPGVGLVSNLIRGTGGRTMGAVFENLHLNSFVMGSVCFLERFLRMPCVVGKSMLMRKSDLEAAGGLNAFKDVLAEDYLMGRRIKELGKRVVASGHMINNVNEYSGIRRFLDRHIRWGKLRWRIGGPRYAFELVGNVVFMSSAPLVMEGLSRATLSFALLVSLLKVLGDWYIGRTIRAGMHPLLYLLSPFKDLLIGAAWFVPLVSRTVAWRGNRYLIGENSMLSPHPETGVWSWGYRLVEAVKGRLA
jgi:ceramide glucosyltransferase